MAKSSTTIAVPSSVYIHSIWATLYQSCSLSRVHYYHICSLYSFYWNRPCQYTVTKPSVFLAIVRALAIVAIVLFLSFVLKPVVPALIFSSITPPLSYFFSNSYPILLPYHITVLSNLFGILTL